MTEMFPVERVARSTVCHQCGQPARPKERTCRACHAADMVAVRARQKAQRQEVAWELARLRHAIASTPLEVRVVAWPGLEVKP